MSRRLVYVKGNFSGYVEVDATGWEQAEAKVDAMTVKELFDALFQHGDYEIDWTQEDEEAVGRQIEREGRE